MVPHVIDAVLLLALIFFAWRGAKKGLILTLFSLLTVFIAFFGARAVAAGFSKPVANLIEPSIRHSIEALLTPEEGGTDGTAQDGTSQGGESAAPDGGSGDHADGTESTGSADDNDFQQILDLLRESGVYAGFASLLEEAAENRRLEIVTTAAAAVAAYLAGLIAWAALFILSFFLILLVCFLVSHALDLAFRLPILSAVNTAGGALLGLVKGALILMLALWAARLTGLLTDENSGQVARLLTAGGLSRALSALLSGAGKASGS